jgi:hypothetical protein
MKLSQLATVADVNTSSIEARDHQEGSKIVATTANTEPVKSVAAGWEVGL